MGRAYPSAACRICFLPLITLPFPVSLRRMHRARLGFSGLRLRQARSGQLGSAPVEDFEVMVWDRGRDSVSFRLVAARWREDLIRSVPFALCFSACLVPHEFLTVVDRPLRFEEK